MRIYDFPRLISWARLSIFWPPKIPCFNTSLEQFLEAVFLGLFFHHTKIYFLNRFSTNLQKSSWDKSLWILYSSKKSAKEITAFIWSKVLHVHHWKYIKQKQHLKRSDLGKFNFDKSVLLKYEISLFFLRKLKQNLKSIRMQFTL